MKAGWRINTLGNVCQVKGGKRVPKGYKLLSVQTPYPYISVADFTENGSVDISSVRYVTADVFSEIKKYTISSADLYLSIAGTVGKTGFVPDSLDGASLTENACKIVLGSDIDRNFLYHFTRSDLFKRDVVARTRTAAQPKLSLERLKAITIPLPPLEEQRRIVAILAEAFAGLDRACVNAETNMQNARELFKSYLVQLFRQGSWPRKTLPEVSENLDRMRVPVTKGERAPGNIPYYGASGVVDYVADFLFDEELLLVSEDGANLLARTYPIAFSVSGKTWVNNHAHVLRFANSSFQEFVRLYLNSISLEPFVSGMAQPKLNQAQLNRIPIPVPGEEECTEVVLKAETLFRESESLRDSYKNALRDLDDLRQSLLHRAFAGELT